MKAAIRRARASDVRGIRRLVDSYTADGRLLAKSMVALYEDVQEFWVAEVFENGAPVQVGTAGTVVGCGALHVLWEDLAEIRTVAVDPLFKGHRIGHQLVSTLIDVARDL